MTNLRETLAYQPNELSFGTSGLRGLASDMTDLECYINTRGFLEFLAVEDCLEVGDTVYIAGDLRDSTPRITMAVGQAISDFGLQIVNCGLVPTPTIAYFALQQRAPCIMVTGSHIPADRNGIKFYKSTGEVLKADEQAIKTAVANVRERLYKESEEESKFNATGKLLAVTELPSVNGEAAQLYLERHVSVFGDDAFAGLELVFYQHSAVGRDLLVNLLEKLGAKVTPVGRSEVFIPIDTENVTPEDQAYFKQLAIEHPKAFGIVSTDGDSDRPFLVDENGIFNRGDILGAVVANWLKADCAAYPVSSSDAVDTYLGGHNVPTVHTRIGSPYVIVAMQEAAANYHAERAVGWEVNGGFMTNADMPVEHGTLGALPTRDAILPIIIAILAAHQENLKVSELFARLPARFTQAGLIDNFPTEVSAKITEHFSTNSPALRTEVATYFMQDDGFGDMTALDTLDGIRMTFSNGDVAHLRPSGNAPQLRIYSVADNQDRADEIVRLAIAEPVGIFRKIESSLS